MQTRVLTESDAEAYRLLRVRALGEEPLAFLRTPDEADSLDEMKRRFRTTEDGTDGPRLLLTALERARQWPDLDHVWLGVTTTQTAARALYASCGFEPFGRHPRALRVNDRFYDEERMVLRIL